MILSSGDVPAQKVHEYDQSRVYITWNGIPFRLLHPVKIYPCHRSSTLASCFKTTIMRLMGASPALENNTAITSTSGRPTCFLKGILIFFSPAVVVELSLCLSPRSSNKLWVTWACLRLRPPYHLHPHEHIKSFFSAPTTLPPLHRACLNI